MKHGGGVVKVENLKPVDRAHGFACVSAKLNNLANFSRKDKKI